MKYSLIVLLILGIGGMLYLFLNMHSQTEIKPQIKKQGYWFILQRKSNMEYLYHGVLGEKEKSSLVKTFRVKVGIPGERPTPIPKLLGRKYWLITDKVSSKDNPETAPYFLTLNIPVSDEEPFGPSPYKECNGKQCDWILPGVFGLHGINGDESRLSKDNPGSSGCIRHSDEDITFLYHLLDPQKEQIRYYIEEK